MTRTATDILHDADDTLRVAILGFEDAVSDKRSRREAGMRNLIVFGRTVTFVLQNLRGVRSDFDEWYASYRMEMENDPLCRYFKKLRNEILKKGSMPERIGILSIEGLVSPSDLGPPPPRAKAGFFGDEFGGSGWEIELPDGSMERFYVELPGARGRSGWPEVPTSHLGQELHDTRPEELARLYITYLSRLVEAAHQHFGNVQSA